MWDRRAGIKHTHTHTHTTHHTHTHTHTHTHSNFNHLVGVPGGPSGEFGGSFSVRSVKFWRKVRYICSSLVRRVTRESFSRMLARWDSITALRSNTAFFFCATFSFNRAMRASRSFSYQAQIHGVTAHIFQFLYLRDMYRHGFRALSIHVV